MTSQTEIHLGPEAAALPEVTQVLTDMLREHDCEVTFTKKDGTERVMPCTLRPAALPVPPPGQDITESVRRSDKVLNVWSLEQQGWRSFIIQNVKSIRALT